jgi:hypothetical protein
MFISKKSAKNTMNSLEFAVVTIGVIYIGVLGFILAKMLCEHDK